MTKNNHKEVLHVLHVIREEMLLRGSVNIWLNSMRLYVKKMNIAKLHYALYIIILCRDSLKICYSFNISLINSNTHEKLLCQACHQWCRMPLVFTNVVTNHVMWRLSTQKRRLRAVAEGKIFNKLRLKFWPLYLGPS